MKVTWSHGRLQFEPESDVEAEAMLVLLDGLKYEGPSESDGPRTVERGDLLGQVERGGDLNL